MTKLKSEQHHWWPRCVSKHWGNEDGMTNWLNHAGVVKKIPSAKLGLIGNAHHIKLNSIAGADSPWDESFEKTFDLADNEFPAVINWLQSLEREDRFDSILPERFLPVSCNKMQLTKLTECAVSLAIRSPRNREASVRAADFLRQSISQIERNALIGLNMRDAQRKVSDAIKADAKFAVLFSRGKEFIYGDGFFHSFTAPVNSLHNPMLLVPITPLISVIIYRPSSYNPHPLLSTLVLSDEEIDMCNYTIQVYSRDMIFFRNEQPLLKDDAFTRKEHCQYSEPNNPVALLANSIPGISSRNNSLFGF